MGYIAIIKFLCYNNDISHKGVLFGNAPNRFALPARNNWMIDKSQYVICNINRNYGGAYKAVIRAKSAGKIIINLAEL